MLSRAYCASIFAAVFMLDAPGVWANPWLENTYLLNITHRQRMSEVAARLGDGGYELSDGTYKDFRRWYEPRWIDIDFHFLTQLSEDFGLLWGLSTGEWAQKYRIQPSFKLGAIVQRRLSAHSSISLSATLLFGGEFREKPCVADYGDIGGVQAVNCRLAASTLEPAETLKLLYNAKPQDWGWVGLNYKLIF